MTYFKATRPDGTDFYSGTVDYAAALRDGTTIKHPRGVVNGPSASSYLSVSIEPGDCTGFSWPARLFEVEPVSATWAPDTSDLPNKVAALEVRVVRELPAHLLFGPQGEQLVALLNAFEKLTRDQRYALAAARDDAWWDAYNRVRAVACRDGLADQAGLEAAHYALDRRLVGWGGVGASYGAALAVLLRHLIGKGLTRADYRAVTAPWREVVGPLHPADRLKAKAG